MIDTWQFVERVAVVRHGSAFQATARRGAFYAVGDFDGSPDAAIASATAALDAQIRPLWEKRNPVDEGLLLLDDYEDLLV